MVIASTLIIGLMVFGASHAAEGTPANGKPAAQQPFDIAAFDRNTLGEVWLKKVEAFRADNARRQPGGVVIIGDSVVEQFRADSLFPDREVITRGIGGDRIIGLIARLEESVFALKPSKLFLMIGLNDTLFPEMPEPEYMRQYEYLFDQLKSRCPDTHVYVLTLIPLYGKYVSSNKTTAVINPRMSKLARKYGFDVIDTQKVFRDSAGEMKHDLSDDGSHPNAKGQAVFRDLLKPYIEK